MRSTVKRPHTVRFTERMHGSQFDIAGLRLAIAAATEDDSGLHGTVLGGRVLAPPLGTTAWEVDPAASHVRLLHRTPDGYRRMTYDLALRAPVGSRRARLLGEKHLTGAGPGPLPTRIWRDTTTLRVRLYDRDTVLAHGDARLHGGDFARQLLSFRAGPITLTRFLVAFSRGLGSVYLRRGGRPDRSA